MLLGRRQLRVRSSFEVLAKKVPMLIMRVWMQSEKSRIRASRSCGNTWRANRDRRPREPRQQQEPQLVRLSRRRKAGRIARQRKRALGSPWRLCRGSSNSLIQWRTQWRTGRCKPWTSSFPKGLTTYTQILPSRAVWSSRQRRAL